MDGVKRRSHRKGLEVIPYGRHDVSNEDIEAVVRVLRSDYLTQGPAVPAFEKAVLEYSGAQFAVAVNSATSALHIACIALELGPGDFLWTSANTFVASANCGLYCGADVDFVDIDPDTYNISIDALTLKLEEADRHNKLPKVLVVVHFAGQPSDMTAISELANQYRFSIIEDASHAVGASYKTQLKGTFADVSASTEDRSLSRIVNVGSCCHSAITIFSFHPVKIVTSGEGGMALTNCPLLAERMQRLRAHGITTDLAMMSPRDPLEIWNYQQVELGFNYRMTDLHAALGLSQMDRLVEFVSARRRIAEWYDSALVDFPVRLPHQRAASFSSYHLYPIRIPEHSGLVTQRGVYEALMRGGVRANLHYIPVHRHPFFEKMGFRAGDYPEAEKFFREVISLPIFPTLKDEELILVIELLRSCFCSSTAPRT